MKKVLKFILVIVLVTFTSCVYAKDENKLYFAEQDNNLYYNTTKFDDKTFMKHTNMIPGKTYTDTLLIKNESKKNDYTLYFQVKERENTELAQELLNNIDMKIYIDDELIYDGDVKGNTYEFNGLSLKNAIKLGEYKKGDVHTLVVQTTLKYEYDVVDNTDEAYIDWTFYGEYDDNIFPIEENPNTYDGIFNYIIIFLIAGILVVCVEFIWSHGKNKAL